MLVWIIVLIIKRLFYASCAPLRLYFKSYEDLLPKEMIDHHEQIINAIDAQDVDLAERLAHEHTREMQQRFLDYLGSRNTSNISVSF